jgi:deoxyribose-phosphate aldolase
VLHQINNEIEYAELNKTLAQRMDFSCVRSLHDAKELQNLVDIAKRYRPACVFVLPSFVEFLAEQLRNLPEVKLGGAVSFPSGGDTTESKIFQTRELCRKGCGEIDMVMNLTLLKTARYKECLQDIAEVVRAAGDIPVKAIIEACILTEDEICRASELSVRAGVAFVKTGTGWVGGAEVKQVELIYQTIGDDAKIKAAGGIRTLDSIRKLYNAGCDRFGIGAAPARDVLKEAGCR